MLYLRQPVYSIASAAIFAIFGFLFGGTAIDNSVVMFSGLEFGPVVSWVACGLMFVMAYFSLVHLKHEH